MMTTQKRLLILKQNYVYLYILLKLVKFDKSFNLNYNY